MVSNTSRDVGSVWFLPSRDVFLPKNALRLSRWYNGSRGIPYASRGRKSLERSEKPWPGYIRITRTVSRLSGQFLDYPHSLWIIRTVSRLSGQCCWLSGQFPDFRKVFGLSWKFPALFRIDMNFKVQYLPYCKNFPDFRKNFPDSNADALTRFFWLCIYFLNTYHPG